MLEEIREIDERIVSIEFLRSNENVSEVLSKLNKEERFIVEGRIIKGLSYKAIASHLKISSTRVLLYEGNAHKKIYKILTKRGK